MGKSYNTARIGFKWGTFVLKFVQSYSLQAQTTDGCKKNRRDAVCAPSQKAALRSVQLDRKGRLPGNISLFHKSQSFRSQSRSALMIVIPDRYQPGFREFGQVSHKAPRMIGIPAAKQSESNHRVQKPGLPWHKFIKLRRMGVAGEQLLLQSRADVYGDVATITTFQRIVRHQQNNGRLGQSRHGVRRFGREGHCVADDSASRITMRTFIWSCWPASIKLLRNICPDCSSGSWAFWETVGFNNRNTFIRAIKAKEGITPREYRSNMGK